jgi:hypothetical protein
MGRNNNCCSTLLPPIVCRFAGSLWRAEQVTRIRDGDSIFSYEVCSDAFNYALRAAG